MTYEIVNLEERTIVGVSARTGNMDPNMGDIIGGLWGELYEGDVINAINHKVNDQAIGLYSDYQDGTYCVTVGVEVIQVDNTELVAKVIPEGRYAKFSIHGHIQIDVAKAWGEIHEMELDRRFSGDFEEYLNCDGEHADINVYIALN